MGETALQKARQVKKKGKGMLEVPLLPMEVHSGADVHQQFGGHHTGGGPHTGADGYPKEAGTAWKATLELAPGRTCGPVEREALAGAGLMTGLVTPWGHTETVPEKLHPLEVTHAGSRFETEFQSILLIHRSQT